MEQRWPLFVFFFCQAEDGIRDFHVTGVQTCALPIWVTALINELAAEPGDGEVLLVLDDYHLIDAPQVHGSLEFLVEHLPPGLHLVLATRSDPPLPRLPRLRAGGQLAELRAADLRFT